MKLSRRHALASMSAALGGATVTMPHLDAAEADTNANRKREGSASASEVSDRQANSNPKSSANANPNPAPVCLADFEPLARAKLSHFAYEYISSGAGDELTLRWNREAYDQIRLRPRVLVDVEKVDTRVTLLGETIPHPILLAPTARHRLSHPDGEVATAEGAGAVGATFVVSSLSNRRLADITPVATAPLWFQLYDLRKERRDFVRGVMREAEDAGCRAFVVTVDAVVDGARNRIQRVADQIPSDVETPYYQKAGLGSGVVLPIMGSMGSFTWEAIEWVRSVTRLPIVLKGILNPKDAKLAIRAGAAGIIVSNHGGRCLDTLPAAIHALPGVVEAVNGRVPVLVDGGIRRGTDVLKALALGAKAVLIGRPYIYGLAANGAEGVARVVNILREELQMAMALTGRPSIRTIDRTVLWRA